MPRIIKRNNSNPWDDVLGGIGQGLSSYAGVKMGREQMNMAKDNNAAMRDMMGRMWGKNGENINTGAGGGNVDEQYNAALNDTLGGGAGDTGQYPVVETPQIPTDRTGGGAAPAVAAGALGLGAGLGAGGGPHRISVDKRKSDPFSDIMQGLFDPGGFVIPSMTNTKPWAFSYGNLTGR